MLSIRKRKRRGGGIKAFAEGNHPFRVLRLPFLLHFDIVQGIRSIRTDFFLFGFEIEKELKINGSCLIIVVV